MFLAQISSVFLAQISFVFLAQISTQIVKFFQIRSNIIDQLQSKHKRL